MLVESIRHHAILGVRHVATLFLLQCIGVPLAHAAEMHGHTSGTGGALALDWSVFSHLETRVHDLHSPVGKPDYAAVGETAFFVSGSLSNKISVLYEGSYMPKRYRDDTVKNERLQIRYDINGQNYVLIGKIHTPVNHWNDSYHHGRLLFPTIARPLALDRYIPLHDAVVRLGGNSVNGTGLFYDVTVGSGHRYENSLFRQGILSQTASAGFQFDNGSIVRLGWHRNEAHRVGHGSNPSSMSMPAPGHAGAGNAPLPDMAMAAQHGGLDTLNILSASALLRSGSWLALTELSQSHGSNDTENNRSLYQYVGYDLTDMLTPYVMADWISSDRGYHFRRGIETLMGVGLKVRLADAVDLKLEVARHRDHIDAEKPTGVEFRAQLSFFLE